MTRIRLDLVLPATPVVPYVSSRLSLADAMKIVSMLYSIVSKGLLHSSGTSCST